MVKPDGTLHVVMPGEPDKRVEGGSPFKDRLDLMQLDSGDQFRKLKIEYIAGVLADGITGFMVTRGKRFRVAFARCLVHAFNEDQPLYALGYARALGDDGDPLWAELAGLLYASGRLTYRDFDAAENYLKLALKKGAAPRATARIRKTLRLIERYREAGGEGVVKEPSGLCGLAGVTAKAPSKPLAPN